MAIDLLDLVEADTGAVLAAADRWQRGAVILDSMVDDLGRETRDLPNYWSSGPGAQAAQDRTLELRTHVGNAHGNLEAIARAVRQWAEDIKHYQQMLRDLVAEADRQGVRIDLKTGLITAPIPQSGVGDDEQPSIVLAEAQANAQSSVDSYLARIAEILDQVNASDVEAERILDENTPREGETPDDELPELDLLYLSTIPTSTPGSQAEWWAAQHPVNQERAIREHPEIIRASEGLPSADREAADRVLRERQLEAWRERHY